MHNLSNSKIAITSAKLEHVKRGVETWARDTAHALKEKGLQVTLCKGSGANHSAFERVIPSIKEHTPLNTRLTKVLPKSLWHIGLGSGEQIEETSFALSLIREARREGFDIIHTQDAHVAQALQCARRFGLLKSKVILGHGTEEPFWFLKKFDYIQHLAPHHLDEAVTHCGEHPGWFAIGNFVDTLRFKPYWNGIDHGFLCKSNGRGLRRQFDIPDNGFVVLSVAAIKKTHKRLDHLIKEIHQLHQSGYQQVYLVIAGSTTKETDQIIKLGYELLGDKIRFLQNQGPEIMPQVHQMADLFVLCSLKEMMPIALLEALASGTPAMVHPYPVEEWMIGEGGESVDMSKTGELAAAMVKYFDHVRRMDIARKAREQAVRGFSKEVIVEQYVKMYEKVLAHS